MKQTAVEWLATYLKGITSLNCDEVIDQAKAMEKEQLIGLLIWINKISQEEPFRLETDKDDIVQQYYNETYTK